jgi:phage-related protein
MTPVYITFRAATQNVQSDISKAIRGSQGTIRRDGETLGRAFSDGFNRGVDTNAFRRVANGIRSMVPEAEAARRSFSTLVRSGYTLGTALTTVVGGISAVISSLGALIGAAGGAASTVAVLGNAYAALGAGMIASRLALGGVGKALQQLNKQSTKAATTGTQTALSAVRDSQAREAAARRIEDAERSLARVIEGNRERLINANRAVAEAQIDLTNAIRAGREEIQQLGFEAEDAALNEQRAALNLEKARETLARVQDLPPNSRARREAELAYQEAELNYRKAKDSNADLAAEQERLARTGVNGLDSVIDARNRVAKAEEDKAKAVKAALQDEEDALRDVTQARKDAQNVDDRQDAASSAPAAAAAAGAAWDDGLNNAQRKFVLFLNSLRPQMEALSEIAANAFLPKLQRGIEILMEKAYPVVATGIGQVAGAMGDAAIILANFITTGSNLDKLASIFSSSADLLRTFAGVAGNLYDILLSIFVATAPMAQRFFDFINGQMGTFANYLNSVTGKNALVDFFGRAEATAVKFGNIFGNVFRGIGGIIDANLGPGTGGDILLTWLEKATSDWGSSPGLVVFFQNVATNATKVLDTLTSLAGILGRLGENQNLGKAFEVLLQGAPALENILQQTVDSAPALAELVVTVTKIVSAMTDTGAMRVFFDTLNAIFGAVLDFVADPGNKAIMDFFGRIFAFMSAIGLVATTATFGIKVFAGSIIGLLKPMGIAVDAGRSLVAGFTKFNNLGGATLTTVNGITGKLTVLGTISRVVTGNTLGMSRAFEIMGAPSRALQAAMGGIGSAMSTAGTGLATFGRGLGALMLGPVGIVIGAIAALVGLFITLYNTNDQFKKDMDAVWADLSKTFADAGAQIMEALQPLIPIFTQIIEAIVPVITTIVQSLVPVFTTIVSAIAPLIALIVTSLVPVFELLANVLGFIVPILATIITVIVQVLAAILKVVVQVLTNVITWIIGAITGFGENWDNFWNGIFTFFSDVWNNIASFFTTVWQGIADAMEAAFIWIDTYIFKPIGAAMEFVGQVFNNVGKFIGQVWVNIQNAINTVWQWIDRYIFAPIRLALNVLQLAFAYAGTVIQKAWQDLQNGLNTIWLWIDKNIFNPIKTAVGLVQQAFENVADGIAKAWDGIKKAAAAPVNFVIETVYNKGLRSFWNDIAGNFGMDNLKLPPAKKVAFATGGVMPGYSPGRDIHKFYSPTGGWLHLSGGEAIMRPEWTRAVGGPAAVERMNRAARRGQAFASGGVYQARTQRFAKGGTTDFGGDFLDTLGNIMSIIGDFFISPLDAVKKHLIDGMIKPLMSGAGDNVFTDLIGGVPVKIAENIGTAFKKFFGGSEGSDKPANAMGWRAMQAIVERTIPGARITSAYRPGSITVNGGKSYHGSGRAIDVVPATMDTFNRMLALFPNARELIYSPAGNRQLLNGKPHYWTGAVRATHWDHVHAAMAKGGTVYPSNGGTIVQVAEAGRAERIEPLDANGMSDRDKAIIDYLTNGGGGTTIINVYQLPGESTDELVERLTREMSKRQRAGAAY